VKIIDKYSEPVGYKNVNRTRWETIIMIIIFKKPRKLKKKVIF